MCAQVCAVGDGGHLGREGQLKVLGSEEEIIKEKILVV